ncbi:MAG: hypothetical protein HF967_06385 [Methanosarcinales archaeon]|nr:hypothetical protein [Methanosarcinales archaeon]
MNQKPFSPSEIKKIYEQYPEIKEKEVNLNKIEKDTIIRATEKEISKIDELIVNNKITPPQKKIQSDDIDDAEEIINFLLEVVKKKNIVIAIETVKKMNNPFILDRFHDILIEKGILKGKDQK